MTDEELGRKYTSELGIVICEAGWNNGPLMRTTPVSTIVEVCGESLRAGFTTKFGGELPLDNPLVAEGTFQNLVDWLVSETTGEHTPVDPS